MNESALLKSQTIFKKNCVFVSAGNGSLHCQLCADCTDFDLHLLVYDDSYESFRQDTRFVCRMSGYKMDMVYQYLRKYPKFIDEYDYFLLLDDDIQISIDAVNELFKIMKDYDLKIGQPSLTNSYYTYEHTLHNPMCMLRYTNFVEMMMPCFSRSALVAVLETFAEHVRWRGIEYHWPLLVNTNMQDIAVIDSVQAVHTRPVQTITDEYYKIMQAYLKANTLKEEICIYSEVSYSASDYEDYKKVRANVDAIVADLINGKLFGMLTTELVPVVCFFCLYAMVSEKRMYFDTAKRAVEEIYLKHRSDSISPITVDEVRKLARFFDCLHLYYECVSDISNLLPKVDDHFSSLSDMLPMLNIKSDYADTAIIRLVDEGMQSCLALLTEKKYNYSNINN